MGQLVFCFLGHVSFTAPLCILIKEKNDGKGVKKGKWKAESKERELKRERKWEREREGEGEREGEMEREGERGRRSWRWRWRRIGSRRIRRVEQNVHVSSDDDFSNAVHLLGSLYFMAIAQ